MSRNHHILSAVLVIVAGTVATWLHLVGGWIRNYDKTRHYE